MSFGIQHGEAVAAFLTLVAVVVGILTYRAQKSVKELAFGNFLRQPIVAVGRPFDKALSILYNGLAVEQVELFRFGIKNSGKVPIGSAEF